MIRVIWPDGKLSTGRTWKELEQAMRAEQWDSYDSRHEFRDDMRRRAEVWSGDKIPASILLRSSKKFITTLADHGAFMIERTS